MKKKKSQKKQTKFHKSQIEIMNEGNMLTNQCWNPTCNLYRCAVVIICTGTDSQISIKKTEVVYQLAPGKPYKEPTITMKGQRLQVVDKFTYLESTLSRVVHIGDEVNARIAKASAAFGRLHGSIWDRSGIRLDKSWKVYRSVVLPTLLYTCETWTVYQRHAKRLNHFHTSCLRKLLKIKWQDRIPDTEILKRAGMQSVHTLLKLAH